MVQKPDEGRMRSIARTVVERRQKASGAARGLPLSKRRVMQAHPRLVFQSPVPPERSVAELGSGNFAARA